MHDLVEKTPQMLPLAGSPELTVLGREVRLGSGYADLLAVESSGRLVIIEVKLAANAEARRAVVAQVLSYAGYLQGLDPDQLVSQMLGGQPGEAGCCPRWPRLRTCSTRWSRRLSGKGCAKPGRWQLPPGDRC